MQNNGTCYPGLGWISQVHLGFGLSASAQVPDKPALAWVACPGLSQYMYNCIHKQETCILVCEYMHDTVAELYTLCLNKFIYKLKLEYVFFSAVNAPK